jgi:hypothetical protein
MRSGYKKVAVKSGQTVTVSCKIRKSSVAAGGANYNGNQPRLVCKANLAAGVANDVVMATETDVTLNNWIRIVGVTPVVNSDCKLAIIVDCDGTTGFINVDSWEAVGMSTNNDTDYWFDGLPGEGLVVKNKITSDLFRDYAVSTHEGLKSRI